MREAQKEEEYEATSKLLGICVFGSSGQACAAPVGESEKQETEKCGGM
jgi:hypothetical protein